MDRSNRRPVVTYDDEEEEDGDQELNLAHRRRMELEAEDRLHAKAAALKIRDGDKIKYGPCRVCVTNRAPLGPKGVETACEDCLVIVSKGRRDDVPRSKESFVTTAATSDGNGSSGGGGGEKRKAEAEPPTNSTAAVTEDESKDAAASSGSKRAKAATPVPATDGDGSSSSNSSSTSTAVFPGVAVKPFTRPAYAAKGNKWEKAHKDAATVGHGVVIRASRYNHGKNGLFPTWPMRDGDIITGFDFKRIVGHTEALQRKKDHIQPSARIIVLDADQYMLCHRRPRPGRPAGQFARQISGGDVSSEVYPNAKAVTIINNKTTQISAFLQATRDIRVDEEILVLLGDGSLKGSNSDDDDDATGSSADESGGVLPQPRSSGLSLSAGPEGNDGAAKGGGGEDDSDDGRKATRKYRNVRKDPDVLKKEEEEKKKEKEKEEAKEEKAKRGAKAKTKAAPKSKTKAKAKATATPKVARRKRAPPAPATDTIGDDEETDTANDEATDTEEEEEDGDNDGDGKEEKKKGCDDDNAPPKSKRSIAATKAAEARKAAQEETKRLAKAQMDSALAVSPAKADADATLRVTGQLGHYARKLFKASQLVKKKEGLIDVLARVIWLAGTPGGISASEAYSAACFTATSDADLMAAAAIRDVGLVPPKSQPSD